MNLSIRACERRDLRGLEWDGQFAHHREIFERTYGEHERGEQVMLVGDLDGVPIAQIWIDLRRGAADGTAVLWALRVHPSQQGRGLGSRMMLAAEDVLRRHGRTISELVVEEENLQAQRLYRRLGYHVTGRVVETYSYVTPDGRLCEHQLKLVHMRKALAPEAASPPAGP